MEDPFGEVLSRWGSMTERRDKAREKNLRLGVTCNRYPGNGDDPRKAGEDKQGPWSLDSGQRTVRPDETSALAHLLPFPRFFKASSNSEVDNKLSIDPLDTADLNSGGKFRVVSTCVYDLIAERAGHCKRQMWS
ncbi:hypothetical protein R1sor_001047 [Riccia sorocarpa]|uniref:Uncharacterized protein n=1 Tax=Riccia sorocarpa TaxID=122646 RepID=A0ABD3GUU4_9MARC